MAHSEQRLLLGHGEASLLDFFSDLSFEGVDGILINLGFVLHVFEVAGHAADVLEDVFSFHNLFYVLVELLNVAEMSHHNTLIVDRVVG